MKRTLAMLLTLTMLLTTVPLGAVNVAAETTVDDFTYTVYDGKATIVDYSGPGGDLVIPAVLDGYPVSTIEGQSFIGVDSLTSLTISDGIDYIGDYAFNGCSNLSSVSIPASVSNIRYGAFGYCPSLTSIDVAADSPYYCTVDGVLYTKGQSALIQFPTGKGGDYAILDGTTFIEYHAFDGCSNLTAITIPDSVTEIGCVAFQNCSHLTSVSIPNSVTTIESGAFYGCTSLTDVYYTGTEEDRAKITIEYDNDYLLNAEWHYNCTSEPSTPTVVVSTVESVNAGDEIEVSVNLLNNPGLIACLVELDYDEDVFELVTYYDEDCEEEMSMIEVG